LDDDHHVVVVDDDHADQLKLRRLREHNSESPAVTIQFEDATRVPSSNGGGSAHSSDFHPTSSLSRLATTPIDVCVQTDAANAEQRFATNKGWV
jgi:hypothetical protein